MDTRLEEAAGRGQLAVSSGPQCFFPSGSHPHPSAQEQSRAISDVALGWAVRGRLGLPGISQPFLNQSHFFFSFRKTEISGIACLTGETTGV